MRDRVQGYKYFFAVNSYVIGQSVGSVIRVTDGSLLQFTDNINDGTGGALYVLSLGQIIIGYDVKIEFSRNTGRYMYNTPNELDLTCISS